MKKVILSICILNIVLFGLFGCKEKVNFEDLEPPLTQEELSRPVPEFLTAEQQNLYLRAQKFYRAANAAVTSAIDSGFDGETLVPYVAYSDGSDKYLVSRGRYSNWEDFISVVDGLFTTHGYQTSIRQIFIECDGKLCFIDGATGSGMTYNENFPDEFELLENTEKLIRFNVVGHYSQLYPLKDEANEEQEKRLTDKYEYTQKFLITLMFTENGWRFDEFHDTFIDQGDYIGNLK